MPQASGCGAEEAHWDVPKSREDATSIYGKETGLYVFDTIFLAHRMVRYDKGCCKQMQIG